MNSVRAYNMKLNELIRPENNQNSVRDHGEVANDHQKSAKTETNGASLIEAANHNSVHVDISPVWQEVAGQIDLRAASAAEVSELSFTLYTAGAITFEDHINLSFQKNPSSDEKIDYITHWQSEQEDVVHQGAVHEDLNDIVRIQSILGYVDSLKGDG